jgi:hypothetical protein
VASRYFLRAAALGNPVGEVVPNATAWRRERRTSKMLTSATIPAITVHGNSTPKVTSSAAQNATKAAQPATSAEKQVLGSVPTAWSGETS